MNYNLEYETQGTTNFLVYKKSENDVLDSVTIGMISNNKIAGILPFAYQQIDDAIFFKYNVSALNTLTEYFQGLVTKKRFLKVMSSLLEAFTELEEYMIEFSAVVLEQNFIFVDPKTAEVKIVVLPCKREQTQNMVDFFKELLFSVCYDETEDCSYIPTIMGFLKSNQFFDVKEFKKFLNDMLKEEVGPVQVQKQPESKNYKNIKDSAKSTIATRIERAPETSVLTQGPGGFTEVEKMEPQHKVQTADSEVNGEIVSEIPEKAEGAKKGLFGFKKKEEKPKKEEKSKKSLFGKKVSEPEEKASMNGNIPAKIAGMNIPGQNREMNIPGQQTGVTNYSNNNQNVNNVQNSQQYGAQMAVQEQKVHLEKVAVKKQDFGPTIDLRSYQKELDGFDTSEPGTQVLTERPYLYVTRTRERFELSKETSKIGSDAGRNDFSISGNSAISRAHVIIHYVSGNVYIEDNYSTNGTKVDGVKMKPGIRSNALAHGTKIHLGNEELELRLY